MVLWLSTGAGQARSEEVTRLQVAEWFAQGSEPQEGRPGWRAQATIATKAAATGGYLGECHRPLSSHRMERGQSIRPCRLPAGVRARQRVSHVGRTLSTSADSPSSHPAAEGSARWLLAEWRPSCEEAGNR
jgi:hypothetical protein